MINWTDYGPTLDFSFRSPHVALLPSIKVCLRYSCIPVESIWSTLDQPCIPKEKRETPVGSDRSAFLLQDMRRYCRPFWCHWHSGAVDKFEILHGWRSCSHWFQNKVRGHQYVATVHSPMQLIAHSPHSYKMEFDTVLCAILGKGLEVKMATWSIHTPLSTSNSNYSIYNPEGCEGSAMVKTMRGLCNGKNDARALRW